MQAGYGSADDPDVGGLPGLYVEVKRYRHTPVARFSRELLDARPREDGALPVLVWKDDGLPKDAYRATLRAGHLFALYNELLALRQAVNMVAQGSGVKA
jgi:hypothetical protein